MTKEIFLDALLSHMDDYGAGSSFIWKGKIYKEGDKDYGKIKGLVFVSEAIDTGLITINK